MFSKPEPSDSVQLFCLLEHVSRKQRASSLHLLSMWHAAVVSQQNTLLTRMYPPSFSLPFLLTTAAVMKHQFDPAGNLRNFCPHEGRISALDSERKVESKGGLHKNPPYRRTLLSSVSLGSRLHRRTVLLQMSAC